MIPNDRLYWYRVVGVASVHDGDSTHLVLSVGFRMSAEIAIRLEGIDTPELGQPGALEARDYLRGRLETALATGNEVLVRTFKTGKYGRYLGLIYIGDEHLNETMIQLGLAKRYDGGAR